MRGPGRRTALAFLLTLGGLAIPSVSWFVVGSREAERDAKRIEQAPRELLRQTGQRLAGTLARRLEALREAEARRPFYHYQNLYHDPDSVSRGASVQKPSPLAQGPTDPLIQTYFQIRSDGRVTLPTVNEEGLATGPESGRAAAEEIRHNLEPAVATTLAAVRRHPGIERTEVLPASDSKPEKAGPGPRPATTPTAEKALPAQQSAVTRTAEKIPLAQQSVTLQKLRPDAWSQNANVNQLYTQLQQEQREAKPAAPLPPVRVRPASPEVVVRIGPFGWHTIPLKAGDGLAALREVTTPDGPRVQGFLISDSEIAALLAGSPFTARFVSGPGSGEADAAVPLDEAAWHVSIDGAPSLAAARSRSESVRAGFRRQFFGGMLGALIALIAVMAVVLQSERLARDRSRLAATAAHELRTPLASLRLYGEMLAEQLGDPDKSKEYARRIAGESERLGRVVSNLLGLARLERRNLTIHREQGDLAEAVRGCVERQRPVLEAAGLRVETELAQGLDPVRFDRDAVSQILQNLLDNAEKYTRGSNGRVVTVRLEGGPPGATISVADNGPGIPASVRSRLFRPFTTARREGAEGLGLGLALTRVLARAHGGDVTAGEAPAGGAIIRVTLPA